MTTSPKIPRKYYKNAQCRELRLLIFQEKNHSGGMHFKEFIGKKENFKEGVFRDKL